ncbi:MAG: L,D-transpeptidase [Hyphomicrobiales bacterium]|nr:L,D-transpeptidase [Hyphomicrobiales bacterium]
MKFLGCVCLALALLTAPVLAGVRAEIDLSDQLLRVFIDGGLKHEWKVSTARRGYRTPVGKYTPIRLERKWFSRKYHWSPMPYSVFFHGGYAIHGTTEIRNLGRPASHGCVRLHPENAAVLFNLVREYGMKNTRIVVTR